MSYTDHKIVFTNTHGPSGWTSRTYNVRITIRQTYTDGTLSSVLSLQNIEIQAVGNGTAYGGLPMYGSVYITYNNSTTTLVSLDNATGTTRAEFSIPLATPGSYNSWSPTSSTSISTKTISHGSDGSATITVGITGGFSIEGTSYFGALANNSGSYNVFGTPANSQSVTLTKIKVNSTLTVNPNGGTWSSSTSSQTFTQLEGSTKTIANPTYTGRTFTGWTKTGGGSLSDTTYTFGTTNGTLKATWQLNTYTVSYNKGANGTGTNTSDTKTYGQALTLKDAIFTQTGYTQDGWSTTDGGSKTYNLSASYTTDAAVTLYPHWTINSYTLTIARNNNNYGTVTGHTSGNSLNYNATATLTANPTALTGYTTTFTSWSKSAGKLSSTSTNPTIFTMGTSNATVTANFSRAANKYSVKFNSNGGTGSMTDQQFTYNTAQKLTANAFSNSGYSFSGWNTKFNGSGTSYSDQQSVNNLVSTNNGSITLYAQWTPNTYTISYSTTHGTAPSSQNKTHGVDLTLQAFIGDQTGTGNKATFTLTGNVNGGSWASSGTHDGSASRTPKYKYSQTYWNTNSAGTGTNYGSQGTYKTDAAATLYAIWSTTTTGYTYHETVLPTNVPTYAQETYTITFNANGGSISGSNTGTSSRTRVFKGWYDAATGGNPVTSSTSFSGSTNIYAQYTTPAFPQITCLSSTCTRDGYILQGWSETQNGAVKHAPGTKFTPTKTQILYAKWEQNEYTISYTSIRGQAPSPQTKNGGQALTLASFISSLIEQGSTVNYTITPHINGGTNWQGSVTPTASAKKIPYNNFSQRYWHDTTAATASNYVEHGSYTLDKSTTMEAIWTSTLDHNYRNYQIPVGTAIIPETITITFNPNGEGSQTTKTSENASRTRELEGWYTAASGGVKRVNKTWDSVEPTGTEWCDANESIYAHYTTPNFSTITTPTANECARPGYNLLGWATSPTASVHQYTPGEVITPTQTTTLYAVWATSGIVYVGSDKYQIFIYNENDEEWYQYRAYIGNNNHEWVPY